MIPLGITVLEDGTIISKRGKQLKLTPNTRGYLKFGAFVGGKRVTFQVHAVVCEAFHGPKPTPKHEVCHNDGDQLNNVASNLRWGTRSENAADRVLHGTVARGERSPGAKLTETQVQEIRTRYAAGSILMRELAAEYGVTKKTISVIISRKMWTHV